MKANCSRNRWRRCTNGKFVRPFLTNKHYKNLVMSMLEGEGDNVPAKLAELYTSPWTVPSRTTELWELELALPHIETAEEETVETAETQSEVIVEEEGLNVVMDEEGVVVVESAGDEEAEGEDVEGELEEDELAEEIEIDTLDAPKQFRLEVMLPIILAAAIILIAIAVMLLYHFVYKKKKTEPSYKLIDATDLMVDQDSISSYETF